jgi:hypothetical protein
MLTSSVEWVSARTDCDVQDWPTGAATNQVNQMRILNTEEPTGTLTKHSATDHLRSLQLSTFGM